MKISLSKTKTLNIKTQNFIVLAGLIIIFIISSVVSRSFLTTVNMLNLVRQVSIIGVLSCGMSMVPIGGGFDLSVGSIVGMSAAVAAKMVLMGFGIPLSFVTSLILGAFLGLINGYSIGYIKINPFVTTIATMTIFRGLVLVFSKGYGFRNLPMAFSYLGNSNFFGLPIIGIIFVITVIISYLFLRKSKYGQYIYAIGGNKEASRMSGLNVRLIEAITYIITGACAALGGIMLVSRVNTASPGAGTGYELDAIAACIIGGVKLGGGIGSIAGVVIGLFILGTLTNSMNLLGVSSYVQQIITGLIILAAIGIDSIMKKKQSR